ncbi:MAG: NRDE family protein [Myxococcota bacterium]|nr:NRDE family protein [Myxococcota bacterium]
MCTLIAAFRHYPDAPLVIAANRDEHLHRPASGPRVWPGSPRFLAPRDEQAGGTWLGLNEQGLFVGVTNRFGARREPSRASRGQLVVEALSARTASELHQRLQGLTATTYNAFHLFYADRDHGFVTWSDGTAIQHQVLEPGLHVLTERSYGAADPARVAVARNAWPPSAIGEASPPAKEIARVLSIESLDDPLASLCIHLPAFEYGTRSSWILKLRGELRDSELWSSEEAPCKQLPVPRPDLLRALAGL